MDETTATRIAVALELIGAKLSDAATRLDEIAASSAMLNVILDDRLETLSPTIIAGDEPADLPLPRGNRHGDH